MRRGFSIVEVAVSCAIVGVLVVASLNAVGATARRRAGAQQRAQASLLAHHLLAEIVAQPWDDPEKPGLGLLGLDDGENADDDRTLLDDVDDYHKLDEPVPLRRDGKAVPGGAGFSRGVNIDFVGLDGTVSGTPTSLKKITVTVRRGAATVASVSAIRAKEWDSAKP